MARKNFLSTDFFVGVSEEESIKAIYSLPQHVKEITLVKETNRLHAIRFLFNWNENTEPFHIDVSSLPLNGQFVCISLHCSYTNGQAFHAEDEIQFTMQTFKEIVLAILGNNLSDIEMDKKKDRFKRKTRFMDNLFSLITGKFQYKLS